ncbi:MAG: HipA N-terminal domain-containing protein [Luteolibacter sp.]
MSDRPNLRCAEVRQLGELAGHLAERPGGGWAFAYLGDYAGPPISLTMPVRPGPYEFAALPPALEGLLPEGLQLESLLKTHKIDRPDTFRQLVTVGADLVGSLTVREVEPDQQG